jgi:hypothetical protein
MSLLNFRIGHYQIFSNSDFWIGFRFFKNSLKLILDWQLGLGFIRVNKYLTTEETTKRILEEQDKL